MTFLPGICAVSAQSSAVVAVPPANVPPTTPYVITSKAANSQVWQRQWYEAAPNGQITTHIESYTEIQPRGVIFFQMMYMEPPIMEDRRVVVQSMKSTQMGRNPFCIVFQGVLTDKTQ